MLEARIYKLVFLSMFLTTVYMGAGARPALVQTCAIMGIVFASDWATSFVLP